MPRRVRAGLMAVLVIAALGAPAVAPAGAATVRFRTGNVAQPYQQWLYWSLMPTTRSTIWIIHREPACGVAECALPTKREIYIYNGLDRYTVYDFMHEVGHIVDYLRADDRERRVWKRFIGKPGQGWWQGADPPGEQWAMAYSLCSQLRDLSAPTPYPGYGWTPSPAKHHAACRLIRRIATHRMVKPAGS